MYERESLRHVLSSLPTYRGIQQPPAITEELQFNLARSVAVADGWLLLNTGVESPRVGKKKRDRNSLVFGPSWIGCCGAINEKGVICRNVENLCYCYVGLGLNVCSRHIGFIPH